jgi:hypothetical protein
MACRNMTTNSGAATDAGEDGGVGRVKRRMVTHTALRLQKTELALWFHRF